MDAQKVVLITGAASGIGRATARLLVQHVAVSEIMVRPLTQEL